MINLTSAYNDAADRRKQGLDFVGKEQRHALIMENIRREEDIASNLKFINKADDLKEVTRLA